ncbi:M16 family metallopeptidase [Winogradskyella luteola]|uniref:Insulinase family protein n=1 Tax=Winogradskyella luteola TaxID=2828330 RepID=A0A9X1JPG3_9FLAO|nr:insulinase family protein [Winogradskyella luteola]MBV7267863.1 insulinase family protein [Winogradskyella luteola]
MTTKLSQVFKTFFVCILLVTFTANAQTATLEKQTTGAVPSDALPITPEVKIGKLSNGLTYYIQNNGKPEDKVELRLALKAGSIVETEDQRGLAHFMEHMNFNGTKNFKKNELVDYLQGIGVEFGADLNAYTGFDQTVYILPIPSDDPEKLDKGFQILQDWAGNALLTDEDIDDERGVVIEEYRTRLGAATRMQSRYLDKIAYKSKYADRLPIGTKENLENFKYESIRNFQRDWYRPNLMAVIAVGDLDVETLEKKIKENFSSLKNPENPKSREEFYSQSHEGTFVAIEWDEEATGSQVQIFYKDKGKPKKTKTVADYQHNMVEGLFSQMINNRLREYSNKPNPPFIYGFSYHGGTIGNQDAYQSFAQTNETGQLEALRVLLEENERVKRFGFKASELERAKKDYLARLERQFKDKDKRESERIVGRYVQHFLQESPIPGIDWSYAFAQKELPKIKLEDVNGLISDFLHDDNRLVILTGPKKEGLTKVTEQEVIDLLEDVKKADVKDYEDEAVREELMPIKPKKGSIAKKEVNNEGKINETTTLTLSNGAKVTYKKTDFKNDEVLMEAFSYGGTSLYTTEELLETSSANRGLFEAGIDGIDKNEMTKMTSGKIVRVRPFIGGNSEGFTGSASPKDMEMMFQMIHLYFTKLDKDPEAFASFISKQKAFLGNILSNPNIAFSIAYGEFISEGNPRYTGFPDEEALDNANYDMAYEKYKERFANAGDFHFYFVGNVDEDKIKDYAETYIASLPSSDKKEMYKVYDFRPKFGSHEFTYYKGTEPKSQVRLTFSGETEYNKDEARAMNALGEILSIKLIEKLREEEGGVYGAGARGSISKLPYSRYNFSISFPCAPENVEKLIAASLAEVESIVKNGPTETDLDKVKKALLLSRKEDLEQNRFWLSTIKDADYNMNDLEGVVNYEANINALTTKDIHNVAKKYLTDGYIKAVLMPEKE